MKKAFVALCISCIVLSLLISLSGLAQTTAIGEKNKELVLQYQERVNSRDSKGAAAYISKDMKNFGRVVGPEGVQRVLDDVFTTFPDWHAETLDIVAIGDAVILRQKVSGTHLGMGKLAVNGGLLAGVPPTGKRFEVSHMHWYTLRDGKIVVHYGNRDDQGMMQQLGLVPLSLSKSADSTTTGKLK